MFIFNLYIKCNIDLLQVTMSIQSHVKINFSTFYTSSGIHLHNMIATVDSHVIYWSSFVKVTGTREWKLHAYT